MSAVVNETLNSPELDAKRQQLLDLISGYHSCAVAFSGGVDSAVVAKAVHQALGDRAIAVTGVSPSLASGELEQARQTASLIGIRHRVVHTDELQDASYRRNSPDRCFHCKDELYTRLHQLADELEVAVIANGANADDLSDYRPGMRAAQQHRVRSPLAECGINKADVRDLAVQWKLPVWNKPASPCLSSRIAYGVEVTPERLSMIDAAEAFLRQQGLDDLRVRYHGGDLARIEVPSDQVQRLIGDELRRAIVEKLRSLGFKFVTLDLEGLRSGSLNVLVSLDELKRF